MSRTMTISSWSASKRTARWSAGSSWRPAKISAYISAIRCGVRRSPSRSGSSPMARRISRTACSIRCPVDAAAGGYRPEARFAHRASGGRGGRRRRRRWRPAPPRPAGTSCAAGAVAGGVLPLGHRREDGHDLFGLQRLLLDEGAGQLVEDGPVGGEDVAGHAVGVVDQPAHLGVDAGRHLVGVVGLGGEVAAQEHLAVVLAELHRPERLAHAVLGDHGPGDLGGPLDVVRRRRWWGRRRSAPRRCGPRAAWPARRPARSGAPGTCPPAGRVSV